MTQVLLETHQQHRDIWTEVLDLLDPALGDVLQAVGGGDGEAEQEHVGVGVREGTQSANIAQLSTCQARVLSS